MIHEANGEQRAVSDGARDHPATACCRLERVDGVPCARSTGCGRWLSVPRSATGPGAMWDGAPLIGLSRGCARRALQLPHNHLFGRKVFVRIIDADSDRVFARLDRVGLELEGKLL